MNSQLIALIANIALTLSVLVAVIFGIAQVKTAAKDRRERLTMETLRNFQTREFAETLQYIHRIVLPVTYEAWQQRSESDQVRFIHISQQMESLGLLVAEGMIDIDLIEKTLGNFVSGTWEKFRPVITDMREKNNDPFLCEYFQWLAEQVDRRMREKPRRPFFLHS